MGLPDGAASDEGVVFFRSKRLVILDSLLPLPWISACVKTGDNQQALVFDDEKQRLREPAHEGATDVLENDRKLKRMLTHPHDENINCLTETATQTASFAFIPLLRVDQFSAGGLGK